MNETDASIKKILDTPKGERVALPDFGAALKPFVFSPLNKDALDSVKNATLNLMKGIPVEDPQVGKITTLWASWTWKQKLYWVWKHKFRIGRSEIAWYEESHRIIIDTLRETLGEDERVSDIAWEIHKAMKKWWYVTCPKSILIMRVSFTPPKPAESIHLNFTLQGGENRTRVG